AVSGAQVVVSAGTGVYRVVGEDLERVWSPGEGSAVSDDILDVVAVSGDRAWVVAADWTGEPVVYYLHELQIGRGDPVLTRSLPASAAQALLGWALPGLGSAAVAASDGAIWYVTDESIVRIADGTESVVARRSGEHLLGVMVNVNIVATGVGGPERADPRPREIGPDSFAELTVPGPTIEQTLYADGDITCPDHWAHDLSLPVGQVQYTPTPQGIEITVTLTQAWPDTEYYVEVNTDEFCQDGGSSGPRFGGLLTDQDGAGSLTLTYAGTTLDAQQPPGGGLLAGDDGAVWVLPTARWFADSETDERDEQVGWEVPCLLTPGGQCTPAELPAPARDIRGLVVGAGGHLWATVCEDGSRAGGWGDLDCPSGRQLMRWEAGWLHVAYPSADITAVGAAPDGSFWATLAQETGQFDHGTLAHYRDGAWTTFPDFATADDSYYYFPADYALTPASSVCRIDGQGPTLVCVDTSLQISRTPMDRFGHVAVADDGAVWVWDNQVLARMPITVP
ncbi:MAG TPA: hypothetical protein VLQ92_13305, partial [Candidatus Limnocylindrales bacterium]|nr:hypothetical protein [Candidatus Limnocylindrales bacterium]